MSLGEYLHCIHYGNDIPFLVWSHPCWDCCIFLNCVSGEYLSSCKNPRFWMLIFMTGRSFSFGTTYSSFPYFYHFSLVPYLTELFENSRMNELKASKSEERLVTKHKMVLSNQTLQDGILRDSHLVTLELLSLLQQFLTNIFIHLLSLSLFLSIQE